MTARKTDTTKKKTAAKKPPTLTLRDPASEKKAELSDDQAVRTLLVSIMNRIGPAGVWKTHLPKDSTERVVAQIMRKCDGVSPAIETVKKASTLAAIFEGTELEDDLKKVPASTKRTEKLVGLTGEKGFALLLEDATAAFTDLYPEYRRSIEKSEGVETKTAVVSVVFHPETDAADAHFSVEASTKIASRKITRTAKARKQKGGFQLELFKPPAS